jgi:hypothetical protein
MLKQENNINVNVDETLHNHFQTLTPLQQKAEPDLMTSKLFQQTTNKLYYYQ